MSSVFLVLAILVGFYFVYNVFVFLWLLFECFFLSLIFSNLVIMTLLWFFTNPSLCLFFSLDLWIHTSFLKSNLGVLTLFSNIFFCSTSLLRVPITCIIPSVPQVGFLFFVCFYLFVCFPTLFHSHSILSLLPPCAPPVTDSHTCAQVVDPAVVMEGMLMCLWSRLQSPAPLGSRLVPSHMFVLSVGRSSFHSLFLKLACLDTSLGRRSKGTQIYWASSLL